jgi:ribosome-binding factor A
VAMKKNSQRAQRVGDQIQRELADLLRLHVKDPRIGMVTVTAV